MKKIENSTEFDFRTEELKIIENMSYDDVREMQDCVVKYEKENEDSRSSLKLHSVLFTISIVLCLVTLLSAKFLAAAFALGLAAFMLKKAYKSLQNISLNSEVIESIKKDLDYFSSN